MKKRLSDVFVEPGLEPQENLLHDVFGESSVAEPEPPRVKKRLSDVFVESRELEPQENLLHDVFGDSTFIEPEPLRVKKGLSNVSAKSRELKPMKELLLGESGVAEPEPSRLPATASPNMENIIRI